MTAKKPETSLAVRFLADNRGTLSATLPRHGPGDEFGDSDAQRAPLKDVVHYICLCKRADENSQQKQASSYDSCDHHMNSSVAQRM